MFLAASITDASCWFLTSTTDSTSKKLSTCCCLIWASQVLCSYLWLQIKEIYAVNMIQCFLLVCTAIIVHQESVCATFGSGLSSACVVDVGDQKTSVCCVEDGVSHRNSRFLLNK